MTAVPEVLSPPRARRVDLLYRPKKTTGFWSWFTTVDHKKIAILYGATALVFFCVAGIEANRERCLGYVQNSIGLVTALNPVLGYEKSVAIAKEALVTNRSVFELVLEKNLLTQTQLDDILKPENMTHPRELTSRP